MRVTGQHYGQNLYRHFAYFWQLRRRTAINVKFSQQKLAAMGISAQPARELLSQPYPTMKASEFYPPIAETRLQETCHHFGEEFTPVLGQGLPLMQQLCHAVAHPQLPQSITSRVRDLKEEERRMLERGILSSQLLDAYLLKLPKTTNYEVPDPVRTPARTFFIPVPRRNELQTQRLLEVWEQTSPDPLRLLSRPHIHGPTVAHTARYNGSLLDIVLPCGVAVTSPSPLPAFATYEESTLFVAAKMDEKTRRLWLRKKITIDEGGPLQQPLPDVAPMNPLIGGDLLTEYKAKGPHYVSSSPRVHPHTVHIHHGAPLLLLTPDQLTALTLLHLYAHAAAYAVRSSIKVNADGLLERPVVVQGVHSHLGWFQPAVFQLNSFGPHSSHEGLLMGQDEDQVGQDEDQGGQAVGQALGQEVDSGNQDLGQDGRGNMKSTEKSSNTVSNVSSEGLGISSSSSSSSSSTPGVAREGLSGSSISSTPYKGSTGVTGNTFSTTVRNVFLYRPFDQLYDSCCRDEVGKPELTGLNTELATLLRAIHET